MALSESYILKPNSVPAYFHAIANAEAPERFTQRFLESLEFKSTNDRLLIKVLKDLGFLDTDRVPSDRYFDFLDRTRSERVVAEAIREAYAGLFAVNTNAHELPLAEVRNKLRTLFKGAKNELAIERISTTFVTLCAYADFSVPPQSGKGRKRLDDERKDGQVEEHQAHAGTTTGVPAPLNVGALQYHINIVLPDSRDQAVFDAIFKSLRDHLGTS